MTTADDMTETYLTNYTNAYDDQDRYGDFVYDLYESIDHYVDERSLLILNRNKFDDFFQFCMKHIDTKRVDNLIQNREINRLQREVGHRKEVRLDGVEGDEIFIPTIKYIDPDES